MTHGAKPTLTNTQLAAEHRGSGGRLGRYRHAHHRAGRPHRFHRCCDRVAHTGKSTAIRTARLTGALQQQAVYATGIHAVHGGAELGVNGAQLGRQTDGLRRARPEFGSGSRSARPGR